MKYLYQQNKHRHRECEPAALVRGIPLGYAAPTGDAECVGTSRRFITSSRLRRRKRFGLPLFNTVRKLTGMNSPSQVKVKAAERSRRREEQLRARYAR